MAKAKVVFIAHVDTEFKDTFVENCPSNMEVARAFSNPKATQEEAAEVFGSRELRDADFLVLFCRWRIPEEAIRGTRRLKFIQTLGQGTEHIPVRLASEMGIPVSNSGGGNAISVAEHTVLLMLATLKNLLQGVEAIRQGKFTKDMDRRSFHHLYEKTVGIIGLGTIGRLVAKLVNGFGANVIFFDPADIPQSIVTDCHARRVTLEELLSTSDVVSLHVPLLKSTKGMLRWEQLSMMKPSAIFINTSRGDLVDEPALIRALREKIIAGAGLDVFDQEPPSRDNPLLNMENVVPTPHIAGMSSENWAFRVKNCWENLQRYGMAKNP